MLVMRSLLFVPANRADLVQQAAQTAADVIVLDLEGSVPGSEKGTARRVLRDAIASLKAAGKAVHVRLNHLDTGLTREDLVSAASPGLDGVALPKADGPRDIRQLDVLIREQELHSGVRPGTIVLIPHIESARGLLRAQEIIEASTRTVALAFGPYDYAADLGLARTPEGRELEYARGVIVTCCAAYGLQALDGTYANFEDAAGLRAEARQVRSLGFRGKYVIHADQVAPVNEAFTPSSQEVENARRVVVNHEAGVAAGHAPDAVSRGVAEPQVARRARELIAYADEIAQRSPGV
jgi:citrate lyase subunit beta/citryl-CoA lyase